MDELSVPVNELAKACASSADAAEWEQFLRRCAPVASLVALRVARLWMRTATPTVVDDIVQEIFLKLCEQERRILREFMPRGEDSFLGLLRIVSASVASDYFRRHYSAKRGGKVVTTSLDEPASPIPVTAADSTPASMQKAVLFAELDRKLRSATGVIGQRDRAIFWLYYLQGLTAEEIAELPVAGLSAKGVESALRRVTHWLRKEMEPLNPSRRPSPAEEPG
ncbi:MAG TPA: sigma-70 family RNA polymerase sigma factor [Terracidiphilus sp.]|nr:sigma-70 family RNA polymerase sigma factor [Terracidiphilus sp.]